MKHSPCRNSQGLEICDLTFRVFNDTANGFLEGGAMAVEDVDEALELAALLAGSECFTLRPSTTEERRAFRTVALEVGIDSNSSQS